MGGTGGAELGGMKNPDAVTLMAVTPDPEAFLPVPFPTANVPFLLGLSGDPLSTLKRLFALLIVPAALLLALIPFDLLLVVCNERALREVDIFVDGLDVDRICRGL